MGKTINAIVGTIFTAAVLLSPLYLGGCPAGDSMKSYRGNNPSSCFYNHTSNKGNECYEVN